MHRYVLILLCLLLSACMPPKQKTTLDLEKTVNEQQLQIKKEFNRPVVEVCNDFYFGPTTPITLTNEQLLPPIFDSNVVLIGNKLQLNQLAERITAFSGIPVQVAPKDKENGGEGDSKANSPIKLARTSPMDISYNGDLRHMLDLIATHFAMDWSYVRKKGIIQFHTVKTQTFTILTSTGNWKLKTVVSNAIKGGGDGEEGSNSATTGEQTLETKSEVKIWDGVEKSVTSMLSSDGQAVVNPGIGTITVTDHPAVLFRVKEYVDQINSRLSKQIAIAVKVYTLETDVTTDHGISGKAILNDVYSLGLKTTTGMPVALSKDIGSLQALILPKSKHFKGSEVLIQALNKNGNVTRVSNGSGITLHNQPLPIQNVRTVSYLASSSVTVEEGGTTGALNAGQVTTGFAASFIPTILDNNSVVLQSTLNISTLDNMNSIESGGSTNKQTIQLPQVSTKAFHQQVTMDLGSTLILAGFEEESAHDNEGTGVLSFGRNTQKTRSITIIAIEVTGLPSARLGRS